MKGINSQTPDKDQVVNVRQKQQESRKEKVGSLVPKRGHTLFEVNLKKKTIKPAEFDEQMASFSKESTESKSNGFGVLQRNNGTKKIVLDGLPVVKKTLIRKEDCIYISALNIKNCLKKLEKRGVIKIKK